jgi:hypothetical protein
MILKGVMNLMAYHGKGPICKTTLELSKELFIESGKHSSIEASQRTSQLPYPIILNLKLALILVFSAVAS